jgi:hypothetical protein
MKPIVYREIFKVIRTTEITDEESSSNGLRQTDTFKAVLRTSRGQRLVIRDEKPFEWKPGDHLDVRICAHDPNEPDMSGEIPNTRRFRNRTSKRCTALHAQPAILTFGRRAISKYHCAESGSHLP